MADRFLGEVTLFGGNFAPRGWALCDGQLLPIKQYQTLFEILGATYGGDGTITFALPDLRGRTPIHAEAGKAKHELGDKGGRAAVVLTVEEMPPHNHGCLVSGTEATERSPAQSLLSRVSNDSRIYGQATDLQEMSPRSVTDVGGSREHTNQQPYLVLNFIIALLGIKPTPE